LASGAAGQDGKDWPQFLGPARDGTYQGNDLAPAWPAGGPPVVWKREVGQGWSGPVVAGGKLILFHRLGDKEVVECLDAATGNRVWSADYPTAYKDDFGFDEGPRATPAIAEGKVYTHGAEGVLTCWDMAGGKSLWHVDTKQELRAGKGFFGPACSPLVEGDAVILNVGGQRAGVVAFDKATGNVLWRATDDEAGYSSPVAATIGGKRRVLALTRAGLVALEPKSGGIVFQFPWRSRQHASINAATPVVVDDLVFISASYGTGAALLRVGQKELQKVWSSDEALSNHYATSVQRDGFLYGFHGRQEEGPSLRCIELKTGKVRWSEDNFGAGTVLLAGDRLVILHEKGQLMIAPATPDGFKPGPRAQVLPFEARAYPALAGGMLYARAKGRFVCLDLRKPRSS
jgi:outer membrane protein assembly factor BamB